MTGLIRVQLIARSWNCLRCSFCQSRRDFLLLRGARGPSFADVALPFASRRSERRENQFKRNFHTSNQCLSLSACFFGVIGGAASRTDAEFFDVLAELRL
jgi:hypothetical protein